MAFLSDRKKLFTEANLQEAFDFLDENQNGYIDRRELKRALEGCDKE
jgi:Ca2+-binding EF-hand superfamily protein